MLYISIIIDKLGIEKKFESIWGFSIKELEGIAYLCIVYMDEYGISAITDLRITIYRMFDYKVMASEYVKADLEYSVE